MKNKSCLIEFKFWEASENHKSSICWKFQLSILCCQDDLIQLIIIFDIKVIVKANVLFFQIYVPLPRFPRPIHLSSARWYVLIYLYICRKQHKDLLYAKSVHRSCAGSHFYGIENDIIVFFFHNRIWDLGWFWAG